MKRIQFQLEEKIYELLKDRAEEEGRSMSSLIREAVIAYVMAPKKRVKSISDLRFVAFGKSDPKDKRSASTDHDEIFAEASLE